jgi:hypothetical protein
MEGRKRVREKQRNRKIEKDTDKEGEKQRKRKIEK